MNCEYLLDANIYIQAWEFQFPEPVFPGFWEWFQANHQSGRIRTIDKVVQELQKHASSAICAWVKENAISVDTSDEAITEAYIRVIKAAQSRVLKNGRVYTQDAIAEFGRVADSFLIASASVHNTTLVTWETPNDQQTSKVYIPDITNLLNIKIITTPKLLLELRPRFTWEKPADSN